MIQQTEIILPAFGRGFHLITNIIKKNLLPLPETGILNVFIQHTSAGLTINENLESTVPTDMSKTFNRLVPENIELYDHISEGLDDMPAHVKSTLTGASLNIPILRHQLALGTWQGIFLCEFREQKQRRKIVLTTIS